MISTFIATIALWLTLCAAEENVVDYVNLLGGSLSKYDSSSGSTLPLLTRPWGAAAWAPMTNDPDCSGGGDKRWWFEPTDMRLFGIRCTHQPSPWIGDYGPFLINAYVPGGGSHRDRVEFASGYDPRQSTFSPYLFKTELMAYRSLAGDATMAFSASRHAGIMKATFPEADSLPHEFYDATRRISVVLNLLQQDGDFAEVLRKDNALETVVIRGYSTQNNGGIENPSSFKNHFVMAIYTGPNGDKPVAAKEVSNAEQNNRWQWADFSQSVSDFTVRVGTSLISQEQAYLNLEQELGGKNFEALVQESKGEWEAQLQKMVVDEVGVSYTDAEAKDMKQVWYTAAFRSALFPRQLSEIDNDGNEVHWSPYVSSSSSSSSENGGDATVAVFSGPLSADSGFWDAYLTLYPLHSLINTDVLGPQMLTGWLNAYKESGWLPKWSSPGHRDSMIGSMADAAFADAIIKNIPGFDQRLAYQAIRKDCFEVPDAENVGRPCLEAYNKHGYIPKKSIDYSGAECSQVVSRTLLYYAADSAVSRAAVSMGEQADADILLKRAGNYSLIFDQSTGFFRSRGQDGKFTEPFDQFAWGGDYTESGPWQYRFNVPFDPTGLRDLYRAGGRSIGEVLQQAQEMKGIFHVGGYDENIHEQTEFIRNNWGQYCHDNQPSFYMLWMLLAAEEADPKYKALAQFYIRKALADLYKPDLEFATGDEDNGSMSSWYLLAASGLYSLAPGSTTKYVLGSPLFSKVTLALGAKGERLTVRAINNSPTHVYVDKVTLNDVTLSEGSVEYARLMQGGELLFYMSEQPTSE